jgi:hypothetical protein
MSNISSNGKCSWNNNNRICPLGQCCTRNATCSNTCLSSDEHAFSNLTISQNGACGLYNNNTKCPTGQSCSSYGWCGDTPGYTGVTANIPYSDPAPQGTTSTNTRCGPEFNNKKCPNNGECCSNTGIYKGWCGTNSNFCNSSTQKNHCGVCNDTSQSCYKSNGSFPCNYTQLQQIRDLAPVKPSTATSNERCGASSPTNKKCPNANECCSNGYSKKNIYGISEYYSDNVGWCGTNETYCNESTQSNHCGICNDRSKLCFTNAVPYDKPCKFGANWKQN